MFRRDVRRADQRRAAWPTRGWRPATPSSEPRRGGCRARRPRRRRRAPRRGERLRRRHLERRGRCAETRHERPLGGGRPATVCLADTGSGTCTGLAGVSTTGTAPGLDLPDGLAFSPGGGSLYVTSAPGAVAVLVRDLAGTTRGGSAAMAASRTRAPQPATPSLPGRRRAAGHRGSELAVSVRQPRRPKRLRLRPEHHRGVQARQQRRYAPAADRRRLPLDSDVRRGSRQHVQRPDDRRQRG